MVMRACHSGLSADEWDWKLLRITAAAGFYVSCRSRTSKSRHTESPCRR
jgi:hypothetical protein